MQQYPIQIGPVGLQDFEVPDAINFGGQQRVFVHRLYGGSRVVQTLGAEPTTISFEGAFTGSDAAARFREVDYLRISAEPIWLSWANFRQLVIVQTLRGEYRSPWWIQFQIGCIAATSMPSLSSVLTGLTSLLTGDLQSAGSAAALASFSLTAVQAAFVPQQALISGSPAQVAASATLTATLARLDQNVALSSSALVSSPAGLAYTPSTAASGFLGSVTASANLAGLVATRGYLTRMNANIAGLLG